MFFPLSLCLEVESGCGVERYGKSYVDHTTGEHDADRDYIEMDKIELLQFTGLLDKNGKEIYEGDIVRREDSLNWIVKWEGQGFEPIELEKWEIIGNIHENPELLSK